MQPQVVPPPPPPLPPMLANLLTVMQGKTPTPQSVIPDSNTQFHPAIASVPLPLGATVPATLGTYDGTSNPEDFIKSYDHPIKTQNWKDVVACKMFPSVLRSYAKFWFWDLLERSITCFNDIRRRFVSHFHQKKKHARSHVEAYMIKQHTHESLEDFIDRYTYKCLKIPGLLESQQVSGFISCLDENRFQTLMDKFISETPPTFAALVSHTRYYIRAMEKRQLNRRNKQVATNSRSDQKYQPYQGRGRGQQGNNFSKGNRFQPFNKHTEKDALVASLSKSPREILLTEPAAKGFKKPPPMVSKAKDNGKYCKFHKEGGTIRMSAGN